MQEYVDFLMFELRDAVMEFEDIHEAVDMIMVTLSAYGSMPETFYKLYTSDIDIDEEILFNALCYFIGIKEMDIVCDCEPDDKFFCELARVEENEFYELGINSYKVTNEWYSAWRRCAMMRADLGIG